MSGPLRRFKEFRASSSPDNVFRLDGAVPFRHSFPLGLQHVLAMFVSNVAAVLLAFALIATKSAANGASAEVLNNALRSAIFMAGVGTMIQSFPILGKVGSRLPLISGASFTFLGVLVMIGSQFGLGTLFVSVIIGGLALFLLGLFAHKWRKFIKPIVYAMAVVGLGLSLLTVGVKDFIGLGQDGVYENGLYQWGAAWPYLVVASISMLAGILWQIFVKGRYQNISVLIALVVGFAAACCFIPYNNMVDFSAMRFETVSDFIDVPRPIFTLSNLKLSWDCFNAGAIIVVVVIYIVTSTEVVGSVSSLTSTVLGREADSREIRGSLMAVGFTGAFAGFFGTIPHTIYAQSVGIVAQTKSPNRFMMFNAGMLLIIASLFTPIASFLRCIPACVLAGTLVSLFGSIAVIGMQMFAAAGFTKKNILIASISVCLGYGITVIPEFINSTGNYDIVAVNYVMAVLNSPVANMFLLSLILSYVIPESFNDPPEEPSKE